MSFESPTFGATPRLEQDIATGSSLSLPRSLDTSGGEPNAHPFVREVSRQHELKDAGGSAEPMGVTTERVRRRPEVPRIPGLHMPALELSNVPRSGESDQNVEGGQDVRISLTASRAVVSQLEVQEELPPATLAKMRQRGRAHFAVLCCSLFLGGWNDGSAGPLIPTIQRVYHVRCLLLAFTTKCLRVSIITKVDFTIVSLIFVCNCVVKCSLRYPERRFTSM
jgi:hypothetical protein